MGTITVNVKDETEERFRKAVEKKLGKGKGKLGEAIDEALRKWADEKQQKEIAERQLKLAEKGLYRLPKGWRFNREEAYER